MGVIANVKGGDGCYCKRTMAVAIFEIGVRITRAIRG